MTAKLYPDLKVTFLKTEGWPNTEYYANAEFLRSGRVRTTPFAVFDGDTDSDPEKSKLKSELIRRCNLKPSQIITLKKNSIEDYLIVPGAIERGILELKASKEQIDEFISTHSNKKNKKEVLDHLFKKFGLQGYSETVHARRIADAMKTQEIDEELREIMKTLAELSGTA